METSFFNGRPETAEERAAREELYIPKAISFRERLGEVVAAGYTIRDF